MPRRVLAILLAAVAFATAGCADQVSPAIRVGDASVSNDELLEEVRQWAGNPMAIDPTQLVGRTPGGYPGDLVRNIVRQRVDFMLHEQEFERLGLQLDEELRNEALVTLFGDPSRAEEAFDAFSDEFAASFTDDVARQIAVQEQLGEEGYSTWYVDAYDSTDIEVHSRYGRWDPATRSVAAPPVAAAAG